MVEVQWNPQPIETAPKNWEPILVWAVSEEEMQDADDEDREPKREWIVAVHSDIQPGTWWLACGGLHRVYEPTLWLPTPPAQP